MSEEVNTPNPFAGLGANEAAAAQAAPAAEKPKRAPAAQLKLGELKAIKYPMPLKAPRFNLVINGKSCEAASTTFGEIKYTYFLYNGASFYVPGHLTPDSSHTFSYPENYKFEPLKLDRAAQSAAAAKAKAAKAPTTSAATGDDAAASGGAASADAGATSGSSGPAEGAAAVGESAEAQANGKSSRKAKR